MKDKKTTQKNSQREGENGVKKTTQCKLLKSYISLSWQFHYNFYLLKLLCLEEQIFKNKQAFRIVIWKLTAVQGFFVKSDIVWFLISSRLPRLALKRSRYNTQDAVTRADCKAIFDKEKLPVTVLCASALSISASYSLSTKNC